MNATALQYPIELDRAAIERVLPHRGEILCLREVCVLAHDHFIAAALWPATLPLLQGHFPGRPLVPGVLLVEAVAQAAGAGLLVGDAQARALGADHIGVLVAIRKCAFRRPLPADTELAIEIHARQMSTVAVAVGALLQVAQREVATVEIVLAHTPLQQLDTLLHEAAAP